MLKTLDQISPEKMALYRATAQRRWQEKQQANQKRQQEARQVAQQAARLLKEQFGAAQVTLFGSVAHQRWFSERSDIDLAVWGMAAESYFTAVASLQDISTFKIDLVMLEDCLPGLREAIAREGQVI